jgi:hypothetical protein
VGKRESGIGKIQRDADELGCLCGWDTAQNNPELPWVQGGMRCRKRSRRPPRGTKPRTGVCLVRGRVSIEPLRARASMTHSGTQEGAQQRSAAQETAHVSARYETSKTNVMRPGARCALVAKGARACGALGNHKQGYTEPKRTAGPKGDCIVGSR